ncbi:conserved protein [Geminocystis sp. NIES-3709]|nr:conserved protein [Geminocystis sp. NIES-3709]
MSEQILPSPTAIGALVREAQKGESKADFIHKLAISLKEAYKTGYWLLLLYKTDYIEEKAFESLLSDLKELLRLLTSILNSAKKNQKN